MKLSSPQRRLIIESDIERRELERQALLGDSQAAAKLLTHKIRAGELSSEDIALAAALGDPDAHKAATLLNLVLPRFSWRFRENRERAIREVLGLSNLSHQEKINLGADLIENALWSFERHYPGNTRLREALKAARRIYSNIDRIAESILNWARYDLDPDLGGDVVLAVGYLAEAASDPELVDSSLSKALSQISWSWDNGPRDFLLLLNDYLMKRA